MTPRIPFAAAGAVLLALSLAACAPSPEPEPAPAAEEPAAPPASNDGQPVAEPEEEPEEIEEAPQAPTCETLIPASMIADYEELGMTAQAGDFVIGAVTLDEGISCFWGDASEVGFGQTYAWGLIDDQQVAEAQDALETEGWTRESDESGVYYTEDPAFALGAPDDEGYNATYLFGDGWVILADTKQSLILINRP